MNWCDTTTGWPAPDGSKIILRSIRWGNTLLTLPEWIEEFERERAASLCPKPMPEASRTERNRRAGHRNAERYLDRHGVGVA